MTPTSTRGSLAGALLAGLGATACCFGPLALVSFGIGGAWIARVRALEPLQPWFIAATVLCMGLAFYRLYIVTRGCAPGKTCALPNVLRRQRFAFWLVLIAIALMFAAPYFASLFY